MLGPTLSPKCFFLQKATRHITKPPTRSFCGCLEILQPAFDYEGY